jgi:hypothetical protein
VSPEDDSEGIREAVRDSEQGKEPRDVGGPDVEVVDQDVETPEDLSDGAPGGNDEGGAVPAGPVPGHGDASRSNASPSDWHRTRHQSFHTETMVGDAAPLWCGQVVLDKIRGPEDLIDRGRGVEGSIVLAKVRESKDKNFGYNAQTGVYENLVTSGVIDPTKVDPDRVAECGLDRRALAHHRVRGGRAARKRSRRPQVGLRAVGWEECISR